MQYKDSYTSSFLCGNGNYSVIDNNSVKVTFCELQNNAYECLSGIISVMSPKGMATVDGNALYAFLENRKQFDHEFFLKNNLIFFCS